MAFGEKLQEVRKQSGMTQETFAEQLHVSRQAVSRWESGRGYPEIEKILYICHRYHTTLDALFADELPPIEAEEAEVEQPIAGKPLKRSFVDFLSNLSPYDKLIGGTLALCNFAKLIFLDGIAPPVAAVVCLTLICTVILSQLIGGLLPVIAEKLNFDPAVMASPLITTIVDTTTLLVYFNIARVLLRI